MISESDFCPFCLKHVGSAKYHRDRIRLRSDAQSDLYAGRRNLSRVWDRWTEILGAVPRTRARSWLRQRARLYESVSRHVRDGSPEKFRIKEARRQAKFLQRLAG